MIGAVYRENSHAKSRTGAAARLGMGIIRCTRLRQEYSISTALRGKEVSGGELPFCIKKGPEIRAFSC